MKTVALLISVLILVPAIIFAGTDDPGFGVYIAPLVTSGHFGISADNLPYLYYETGTGIDTAFLNPTPADAERRLSLGGKLGIFYRPDNYEKRHRFDIEVQGDYFNNEFRYQVYSDVSGIGKYSVGRWSLTGMGAVIRIRWAVEVQQRWEPYVHVGYGINQLKLGEAQGASHGPNVGAGIRVKLCSKYAFYFEYETSPMMSLEFPLSEMDPTFANFDPTTVSLEPGYSQVSVGFEFPISFCISCPSSGSSTRGPSPNCPHCR